MARDQSPARNQGHRRRDLETHQADTLRRRHSRQRERPALAGQAQAESSAVLRWAVVGCLDWQKHGLIPPEAVATATAEYRSENDLLAAFLEDCCVTGEGFEVKAGRLYSEYRGWSDQNGETPLNNTRFGRRLTEREFKKEKRRDGWYYLGIGVRA